ncbi:MAG: 23S rRNA (guanosine(2251)-2'-O)-methyltransferase RlmB [Chloroflexia bacterium]
MREFLGGRNAVYESLRAGRRTFHRLVLAEGLRRAVHRACRDDAQVREMLDLARERGCPVEVRPRGELSRLAGSREHQGVLLEAGPYPYVHLDDILAAARSAGPQARLLLLDRLQDPQNVGTLLRTAEAVGVQGVLLPEHGAAAVTPAVVRASAGACEHLRIARVDNLVRAMARLKEAGIWVLGLEKAPQAVPYTEVDWARPVAVVVGSEGAGLRRLVRERCDGLVALPMSGHVNSLNAAVAGSVILYEIWRRQ